RDRIAVPVWWLRRGNPARWHRVVRLNGRIWGRIRYGWGRTCEGGAQTAGTARDGRSAARGRLRFVDLSLDVGELLLHVGTRVADALVVHRRPERPDEEVDQPLRAEVADRLVEVLVEVLSDQSHQRRLPLVREPDAQGRLARVATRSHWHAQ